MITIEEAYPGVVKLILTKENAPNSYIFLKMEAIVSVTCNALDIAHREEYVLRISTTAGTERIASGEKRDLYPVADVLMELVSKDLRRNEVRYEMDMKHSGFDPMKGD